MKFYNCLSILLVLISTQALCMNITWQKVGKQVKEIDNPVFTAAYHEIPSEEIQFLESGIQNMEERYLTYTQGLCFMATMPQVTNDAIKLLSRSTLSRLNAYYRKKEALVKSAKSCTKREDARQDLEQLYLLKRFESKICSR